MTVVGNLMKPPTKGGWEMHIVDKTEYGDGLTTDAEKTWMDLPDYSDYT